MAATAARAPAEVRRAYLMAMTDWLACAAAGAGERAPQAMRSSGTDLLSDVAFAGTAGHVLDFDDTFADGVAHLSAPTAPAALVVAAHRGLSVGAALDAYAEGFEAMAAVAAASHPSLYDRGWHPTAVCGPVGAAVAAARLLGLTPGERDNAVTLAMLRAGGTRGAFGTDGKSIQVGLAAAAGVQGALLAGGGATVDARALHGPVGAARVLGAAWPRPAGDPVAFSDGPLAISRNWIKLHPSCLGTHSPIDAAAQLGERTGETAWSGGAAAAAAAAGQPDSVEVVVHPVARQAAHLDAVQDGLSAKFSIPYCVAFTLVHGPPRPRDFVALDAAALERSSAVRLTLDPSLPEFGAVLRAQGLEPVRVDAPRGSPDQPLSPDELAAKVIELAGQQLLDVLEDADAPAAAGLEAAGLRPGG